MCNYSNCVYNHIHCPIYINCFPNELKEKTYTFLFVVLNVQFAYTEKEVFCSMGYEIRLPWGIVLFSS